MDPFAPIPHLLSIDFDGVMHPVDAGEIVTEDGEMKFVGAGLFQWMGILEQLLAHRPDIYLCVHSTWRHSHTDEELAAFFPPSLAPCVLGATPRGMSRHEGIAALAEDHQVQHLAILDDMAKEFVHPCPELILCDPQLGLSDPLVQARLLAWIDTFTASRSAPPGNHNPNSAKQP